MAKKDKDKPEKAVKCIPPEKGLGELLKLASKDAARKGKMMLASDVNDRYVDFTDVRLHRPCILLEYLFCSRGPALGRVIKIDAEEATGKSSLLYLLYGMAQLSSSAYIMNHETEQALMPKDRIANLGCDPDKLMLYRPGDVDDCLDSSEQFVLNVRNKLDTGMKHPIYVGIDSVSSIPGTEVDLDTGEPVDPKGRGLGYHARRFSEFFRDKLSLFARKDVVLLGTGQHKTGFTTLPGGRQMAAGKTSLAEGPFKFHSSWIITMKDERVEGKPGAVNIVCRTTKNKLGPKGREIKMLLYNDERGWNFDNGTASLLTSSNSPFGPQTTGTGKQTKELWGTKPGGLYFHHQVADGACLHAAEFVAAFYANEALVMQAREFWKVRGFGFKFEEVSRPRSPLEMASGDVNDEDESDAGASDPEPPPPPPVQLPVGLPKVPGARS